MSIRQFRPMTAGTRFRSVSGFDEITRTTPEKSLLEPVKKIRRPQQPGSPDLAAPGRRSQAACTARSTSSATSSGFRARSPRSNTIPNRNARIALHRVRRRREALHPAPEGAEAGRHRGLRPRHRRPDRATRCRWARSRSAPRCTTWSSRSARAARWRARAGVERAGGGEGRRVRHPPAPVDRDAPGARPLPGHHR